MTVTEELGDLVRTIHRDAGPSVVAIGRHGRGSGFVVAAGTSPDQRPQPARRDHRGALRRRPDGAGDRSWAATSTATSSCSTSTPPTLPALAWADEPVEPGDVVVTITAGGHQRRSAWGQVTATEAGFRGPRGRPIVGAIEHSTPCASGSSGAPVLNGGGRVVGHQHAPPRARVLPGPRRRPGRTRRRRGDVRGAAVRAATPRRGTGSDRCGSPPAPLGRPRRARRPPGPQCGRRLAGRGGRAARRRPPGARRWAGPEGRRRPVRRARRHPGGWSSSRLPWCAAQRRAGRHGDVPRADLTDRLVAGGVRRRGGRGRRCRWRGGAACSSPVPRSGGSARGSG